MRNKNPCNRSISRQVDAAGMGRFPHAIVPTRMDVEERGTREPCSSKTRTLEKSRYFTAAKWTRWWVCQASRQNNSIRV